ncbi:DoxX family protein [bacterium]|nr:DoxX family protein [bacterium]
MIKAGLLIFLTLFFVLSGFNHLYNSKVLIEYAHKRHLFSPRFSVVTSGIALVVGGVFLQFAMTRFVGAIGLAFFVLLAAFLLHRFWDESDKEDRLLELQNFVKNFAIAAEMLYIAFS